MIEVIKKIEQKENLSQDEIAEIMKTIMSGEASDENIEAFLLALREKGPTIDEITGAARIMREFVVGIKSKQECILDTCGTGGDKLNTFNISTITAIVASAAGVVVAKHGNRSVSSQCGSADILEGLGVNLDLDQKQIEACLNELGVAFLFAQKLHPAMKNVGPVRKKLGVETIFNILGPLTNPAQATHQIMGVYDRDLVELMANVLKNLGLKRVLVVHGNDGLDEITTTDTTFISEYNGKEVFSYEISPDELWVEKATLKDLKGGQLKDNIQIFYDILNGQLGPKRNIVVLNAAYALYIAGKVDSIPKAIDIVNEVIDSKKGLQKLEQLIQFTQKIKV